MILYPFKEEAEAILKTYNIPAQVFEHSKEVSSNARKIGLQINSSESKFNLDVKLLEIGGLLHDIGRWKYNTNNGYSFDQDFHEYETRRLLTELKYPEFGEMISRHPLGGLTSEETRILGYPEAVDLMPVSLESKIICMADKIRHSIGILNLQQKLDDYRTNSRLHQRYFNKLPGLLETTIYRVTAIWNEVEEFGMKTEKMR